MSKGAAKGVGENRKTGCAQELSTVNRMILHFDKSPD